MKKFEGILIVSDIDGTLVGKDGIPLKNLEKLRYFLDNGGLFTVSTGRNHHELDCIREVLADFAHIPFSICNGSVLYDLKTGEFLHPHYLNTEHLEEVITYILEHFSAYLSFHSISCEHGFVRPENGKLPSLTENNGFKLLFWTQASEIRAIHADVSKKFGNYYTFTIAGPRNFEVMPLGGSKMYQFDYLKQHYQVKTIWSIGDYDNDLEMLAGADIAVCPENATEAVKAICDYHVCHCEDGALAEMIDLMDASLAQSDSSNENTERDSL